MLLLLVLLSLVNLAYSNKSEKYYDHDIDRLAIVIVPVADASNYPFQLLNFSKSIENIYKELPFAPEIGKYSCPRMHQMLFNERVRIIQELKDEVEIEVFNVFYDENGKQKRTFWTLKKWLKTLKELKLAKIDLSKFPEPFTSNRLKSLTGVLTLTSPFYDKLTNRVYSAGTRFVRNSLNDKNNSYAVYILDTQSMTIKEILVPKSQALVNYPESKHECRQLFLQFVRKWAKQKEFIPYVWGGCSIVKTHCDNCFSFMTSQRFGENVSYWIREKSETPCTGIECSGLIFRAAQICGIPYFLKNTYTIANNLTPLAIGQEITEGDLIWYSGHVLIISDIKNNKIIESVGYRSGFGKTHEISLSKVFKNINTYSDLLNAYRLNQPLNRLDIIGRVVRIINKFLILKM